LELRTKLFDLGGKAEKGMSRLATGKKESTRKKRRGPGKKKNKRAATTTVE